MLRRRLLGRGDEIVQFSEFVQLFERLRFARRLQTDHHALAKDERDGAVDRSPRASTLPSAMACRERSTTLETLHAMHRYLKNR